MVYCVVGFLLLIPFVITTDIGARARNPNIAPHHRPGVSHNPTAMAILNMVWLASLIGSIVFLVAGSGGWTALLFPGGVAAIWILQALSRNIGR